MSTFTSWNLYLFTVNSFYKVNVITFILLLIFQDEHLLDGSHLGLFDYPYINYVSNIKQQDFKDHFSRNNHSTLH